MDIASGVFLTLGIMVIGLSLFTLILPIAILGTFFLLLSYIFNKINKYNRYTKEREEKDYERIPVVKMSFKDFLSYYSLFPETFEYTTYDRHWYVWDSERNVQKMFYTNELNRTVNRIVFSSFLEWLKFHYWNKKRMYVEKKKQQEKENIEWEKSEKIRISRETEQDKRATELVYQDLLNRVEKEVKLAHQEIQQGIDGMKQAVSGGFNG